MAQYLYRLGHLAARRRRWFLVAWMAVLVLVIVGAATLSGTTDESFSIPGTESQVALDLMAQELPGSDGASARVVFAAPEGSPLVDGAAREAVEASVASLAEVPSVLSVSDPFAEGGLSQDGSIAYATVTFDTPAVDLSEAATGGLEAAPDPATDAGS